MKTIVVGHSALDHIFRVERLPGRPSKVRALEHRECGGGSAANAAAAIARLGGAVEFWSRVGDDDSGRRILSALSDIGVDTRFVLVHQGSRSSEAAVIVDAAGERLIVSERDHAMPADIGWLPLAHVTQASVVLSDLRWFEATKASFEAARAHGVKTVLDVDIGGGNAELATYLDLTDYAIFSAPALANFAGDGTDDDRLGKILEHGVHHAGVTLGPAGYVWRTRDGASGRQPAFAVDVVDSTGAGDAFHGAFAWALAQGHDDRTCARIGAAVAALKCRKLGARDGLPRLDELEDFLGVGVASLLLPTPQPQ